ncbi:MAG: Ig-like domain-containing protein, partial [Lachnospiraceae bacterium]|nr:Ig-like domain-containing protein [Lachnospiraceae bacterium]
LTAFPGTVLAGELTDDLKDNVADVQLEDAPVFSGSEDIILEPVSEEELANIDEVANEETEEVVNLDGDPAPGNWKEPVAYKLGTTVKDSTYKHDLNDPEQEKQGIYYDKKFYKFSTEKDGYYKLTATANGETEFHLTNDLDKYFNSTQHKDFKFGSCDNSSLEKEIKALKGQELFIVVDGNVGWEKKDEKPFEFTFSLEREVTLFDKENPTEISLDKAQTTKGTIEHNFDGKNIYFNENENLSAHYHYYQMTVENAGRLNLEVSTDTGIVIDLYDAPHWTSSGTKVNWTPGTETVKENVDKARFSVDLKKGIYNLFVSVNTSEEGMTDYTIKTEFKPITAGKNEELLIDDVLGGSRNDELSACPIKKDTKYVAQSSVETRTKTDWYKLTLDSPSKLFLSLSTTEIDYFEFIMKDDIKDTSSLSFEDFSEQSHIAKDKPLVSKPLIARYRDYTDIFPTGTYYIGIMKFSSGSYHFELSSGGKKKVSSIKLNKKETTLSLKGEETLTAAVGPADADNKSIVWTVTEHPELVEILKSDDETCTIKGVSSGYATLTATTSNPDVSATCRIHVLDQELDNFTKDLDDDSNVVSNEKIALISEDYFGKDFQVESTDKFEVRDPATDKVDKKLGSVKKDKKLGYVFCGGKKSGDVKVTRMTKVGKTYLPNGSVTFKVEVPKYFKDSAKNKDIKVKNVSKRGDSVKPEEMIDMAEATVVPNYFVCNAKAGFVEFNNETGELTVLKSGKFKVTAYYGFDIEASKSTDKKVAKNAAKNAGKLEYTVTAKLPTVKDFSVKPGKKGKTVNVTVKNIPENVKLTAENWKAVKVLLSDDGTKELTDEGADFKITPTEVKGNFTKCAVEVPTGTEPCVFAVVVTVDEIDYPSFITVKQ